MYNSENKNFDWAGTLKGASSIATAAATDIFDIINSTKSNVDLHQYNYDPRFANSMHELSTYSPTFQSAESLHKPTFGEAFMDINMRTGRGAMAGISGGPWAILGSAIGGTLSGVTNSIVKSATYNKDRIRNKFLNNNLMDSYDIGFKDAFSKNNLAMRDYTNYNRSKNQFDQGGQMNTMKDVSTIDAGGSHEANPYGGVPMGIGSNGKQNLVEEGEVIWKGYVFPKRQMPDTDILKKFNTNFKKKFISYADAAQFIIDLHKEQSNNAYDQQTFEVEMTRLRQAKEYQDLAEEAAQYGMTPEEYTAATLQQQVQQAVVEKQQEEVAQEQALANEQQMLSQPFYQGAVQFSCGGKLKGNVYANGGDTDKRKRWMDFYNKVIVPATRGNRAAITDPEVIEELKRTFGSDYTPMSGEEYKFTIPFPNEYFKNYGYKASPGHSTYFASLSGKPGSKFDTDVTQRLTEDMLQELEDTWGVDRSKIMEWLGDEYFGPVKNHAYYLSTLNSPVYRDPVTGKELPEIKSYVPDDLVSNPTAVPVIDSPDTTEKDNDPEDKDDISKWYTGIDPLRYAPVFNNLRNIIEQNEPDFTYPNALKSLYQPLETRFVGKPVSYTPIDQYSLLNRANQANNATIGLYRNNATTPAAAAFYAANANQAYQQGLANTYRQAMEYNDAKNLASTQFNNQLLMANEQNRLNVENGNRALRTQLYSQAFGLEDAERLAVEHARETNRQNLADMLGTIGKEHEDYMHVANNMALMYGPWAEWYKKTKAEDNSYKKGGMLSYPSATPLGRYEQLAEQLNPEYEEFKSYRSWKKEHPKEERNRLNYKWDKFNHISDALRNSWVNRRYMSDAYNNAADDIYSASDNNAIDKGFLSDVVIQPDNDRTRYGLRKRIKNSSDWYTNKLWEYQNQNNTDIPEGEIKQLSAEAAREMAEEERIQQGKEFRHSPEGAKAAALGTIGLATAPFTTPAGLVGAAATGTAGMLASEKLFDQYAKHWRTPDSRYTNQNPTWEELVDQWEMNDNLSGNEQNDLKYKALKAVPDIAGTLLGIGASELSAQAGKGVVALRNAVRRNTGKTLLPDYQRFLDRKLNNYNERINARRINNENQTGIIESYTENPELYKVNDNGRIVRKDLEELYPDARLATPEKRLDYEALYNRGNSPVYDINTTQGIQVRNNALTYIDEDGLINPIDLKTANTFDNTKHWITKSNGNIQELNVNSARTITENGKLYIKDGSRKYRISQEDADQILQKKNALKESSPEKINNTNEISEKSNITPKKKTVSKAIKGTLLAGSFGLAGYLGNNEIEDSYNNNTGNVVQQAIEGDTKAIRSLQKMNDKEQFDAFKSAIQHDIDEEIATNGYSYNSVLGSMFSDDTPDEIKQMLQEVEYEMNLSKISDDMIDNPAFNSSSNTSSKLPKIPKEYPEILYKWYMGEPYSNGIKDLEPAYIYMSKEDPGSVIFQKELLCQYLNAKGVEYSPDESLENLFIAAKMIDNSEESDKTEVNEKQQKTEPEKTNTTKNKTKTNTQKTATNKTTTKKKTTSVLDISDYDTFGLY